MNESHEKLCRKQNSGNRERNKINRIQPYDSDQKKIRDGNRSRTQLLFIGACYHEAAYYEEYIDGKVAPEEKIPAPEKMRMADQYEYGCETANAVQKNISVFTGAESALHIAFLLSRNVTAARAATRRLLRAAEPPLRAVKLPHRKFLFSPVSYRTAT
jgi:hypothetical protein